MTNQIEQFIKKNIKNGEQVTLPDELLNIELQAFWVNDGCSDDVDSYNDSNELTISAKLGDKILDDIDYFHFDEILEELDIENKGIVESTLNEYVTSFKSIILKKYKPMCF